MIFEFMLTTTLAWTNPSFNVDTVGCGPGPLPLEDLDRIEVWGSPRWGDRQLIAVRPGIPGAPDSVTFDLGPEASGWVVAVDRAGNRSCPTYWQVGGTVSVSEPPEISALREKWYDVMGRRVDAPKRSGIYFTPGKRKRIVKVK